MSKIGMEDLKQVIEKIGKGDYLTDTELKGAIEFYESMEEGLDMLGPDFALCKREVWRKLDTLRSFKYWREVNKKRYREREK